MWNKLLWKGEAGDIANFSKWHYDDKTGKQEREKETERERVGGKETADMSIALPFWTSPSPSMASQKKSRHRTAARLHVLPRAPTP